MNRKTGENIWDLVYMGSDLWSSVIHHPDGVTADFPKDIRLLWERHLRYVVGGENTTNNVALHHQI